MAPVVVTPAAGACEKELLLLIAADEAPRTEVPIRCRARIAS